MIHVHKTLIKMAEENARGFGSWANGVHKWYADA